MYFVVWHHLMYRQSLLTLLLWHVKLFNAAQYFRHYEEYMYRLKVLEEENTVDCAKLQKVLWINGRKHAKSPNDERTHVVFTPGMYNTALEAEPAIAEQEAILNPHDPMSTPA
ncbi:hypothetical protein BU17DRAFT_68539 [Hysterangium stoloniferum]|nr:hypothetical protein BU17DRAFT_68539 [Hysterangium stoloniferum]